MRKKLTNKFTELRRKESSYKACAFVCECLIMKGRVRESIQYGSNSLTGRLVICLVVLGATF